MSNEKDIKKYAKLSSRMEKRFRKSKRRNVTWQSLGKLRTVQSVDRGVHIHGENGTLSLVFLTPSIVQVRLRPDKRFPEPFSYALDPNFEPTPVSITITEDAETVLVGAGGMACIISRANSQLRMVLPTGQEVSLDTSMTWSEEGVTWTRQLPPDERCHGLGQHAMGLNLRGKRFTFWNFDPIGYQRNTDPVYYSIPFYFGVHKDYAIGILWDNPARGAVDLGCSKSNQMQFSAEAGELRFYLIADANAKEVLKRYFELTGPPPLLPLWAFGYHQSRWTYTPSDKFRQLANEFRTRQIPCDVLHFDIDYMDEFRVFTWNSKSFGDLPFLLKELKEKGFKTISILDPAIKADPKYEAFENGKVYGAFHTYPDGELFLAPVWAGESAFPDFTNPTARAWWANQVAELMSTAGFDGFWNDMNEPTIFLPKSAAGTIPDFIPAYWEGQPLSHLEGAHNVYGMQMARATSAGMLKARPKNRMVSLTRCAYAGAQRYTGSWTGDNAATWDQLRLSISMVLNLGLSGMIFTGPDIGGFFGTPTPELYARWIQLGSLLPFCRTHSAAGTPDQEPWSFGTEVEKIAREYIGLRYQLLPYIYSNFAQAVGQGLPLVYPTFMYDPNDSRLYEQDDVFMLGDSLLVAPVLERGATSREIYLPRGAWYDFWTNKLIDGARSITVEAPLDRMPIFAKAGKVIPMWETQQYVGEKPIDELRLRAYAGSGETAIYEDAGETWSYLDGEYRWSYFTCAYLPNGQYAIDWRTAGNYRPSYTKSRIEIIGIPGEPDRVLVDGAPAAVWFFERGLVEIVGKTFKSIRLVGKARDDSAAAKTVVSRSDVD